MAIAVDEKSATIKPVWAGVKAGIAANADDAFFHLTNGFHMPGKRSDLLRNDDAWTSTGSVRVAVGPGDTMKDWKFGFLQAVKFSKHSMFYAGRTRKDGSTSLVPLGALSSLIPAGFMLDCDNHANPFYNEPLTGPQLKSPVFECKTGDHPCSRIPWFWNNPKTGGENLFFQGFYAAEFWTVLSLLDPGGRFMHLAHFKWSTSYELKVMQWKRGATSDFPTIVHKIADATKNPIVVAGPPTEPVFAALKLDGSDRPATDKLKEANRIMAQDAQASAVTYNGEWFANVPRDFFQP